MNLNPGILTRLSLTQKIVIGAFGETFSDNSNMQNVKNMHFTWAIDIGIGSRKSGFKFWSAWMWKFCSQYQRMCKAFPGKMNVYDCKWSWYNYISFSCFMLIKDCFNLKKAMLCTKLALSYSQFSTLLESDKCSKMFDLFIIVNPLVLTLFTMK